MRALLLVTALLSIPAQAQQVGPAALCEPHAAMVNRLATKFHESSVWTGIAMDRRTLLELFMSDGGATWTLVRVSAGGLTCFLAAGEGGTAKVALVGRPL